MIKAILWDIDGVIIRHVDYFDKQLKEENYHNPTENLREFRNTSINKQCDQGLIDPLEEIIPFLNRIGWKKSNTEYFDAQYQFEEQYIDYNLLRSIQKLRDTGYRCYITSNQNYYRKDFLLSKLEIEKNFNGHFFSYDIKAIKTENAYWDNLVEKLYNQENITPENMIFLDDMKDNLNKAEEYGINTCEITSILDIENCMRNIFKESLEIIS